MEERVGFFKRLLAFVIDIIFMIIGTLIVGPALGGLLGTFLGGIIGGTTGGSIGGAMGGMDAVGIWGQIGSFAGGGLGMMIGALLGFILFANVYQFIELVAAATPGKMILGIAIGNLDGTVATSRQLLTRYGTKNIYMLSGTIAAIISAGISVTFGGIIGTLGALAGIIVFWGNFLALGPKKQTLHDKIAKTSLFYRETIIDFKIDIKGILLKCSAVAASLLLLGAISVFLLTKKIKSGAMEVAENAKSIASETMTNFSNNFSEMLMKPNVQSVLHMSQLSSQEKQSGSAVIERFFQGVSEGKINTSKVDEIRTVFCDATEGSSGLVVYTPKQSIPDDTTRAYLLKMEIWADVAGIGKMSTDLPVTVSTTYHNQGGQQTNGDSLNYRTWTSADGRKTSAAFVSFAENKVSLKSKKSGKMYSLDLSRLSEEDQDFVKNKIFGTQEKFSLWDDNSGNETQLDAPRKWTNHKGKSITGTFLKFEEGKVHLESEKTGKVYKMHLKKLSSEDQKFITENVPESILFLESSKSESRSQFALQEFNGDLTGSWVIHNKPAPNTINVILEKKGKQKYQFKTGSVHAGLYEIQGARLVMIKADTWYKGFVWEIRNKDQLVLTNTNYKGSVLARN